MSPAETLTACANLIEARANNAVTGEHSSLSWEASPHLRDVHCANTFFVCDSASADVAEHIASFAPNIALALVPALRVEAIKALADEHSVACDFNGNKFTHTNSHLLAFARTYLNLTEGENHG